MIQETSLNKPRSLYIYTDQNSYEPLARIDKRGNDPEKVMYFHTDLNGCPEELTDENGEILWECSFQLWGKRIHEIEYIPIQQNLRYQGQYLDRETGLHYNTFRYYDPDIGRFTQPDPIGLLGGFNLYQYAPNGLTWIDPLGLSCTGKMQPYRFDDVRVKGPHLDISINGRKITEAKLGLDKAGDLVWERFGDMKGVSKKSISQANKHIEGLINDKKIMGQTKTQISHTIEDFKKILNDPNSNKRSIELAERGMVKFSKMLEKINGLN
jgi:RHS repeat-associated protein